MNAYGHCRIPTEREEQQYQRGEYAALGCEFPPSLCYADLTGSSVGVWAAHASEDLLIPVMRLVMSVKPPSYRDVLELDKKIRSFKLPETTNTMDSPGIAASMVWYVRSHYMEMSKSCSHYAARRYRSSLRQFF